MYMEIKRLLSNDVGKIIISILLGLGLSSLFNKVCQGKDCLEFQSPEIDNIKEKNLQIWEKNVFQYELETTECENNKKNVDIA